MPSWSDHVDAPTVVKRPNVSRAAIRELNEILAELGEPATTLEELREKGVEVVSV